MLLAMLVDHRLPGQMMLKTVDIFHCLFFYLKIYKDLI